MKRERRTASQPAAPQKTALPAKLIVPATTRVISRGCLFNEIDNLRPHHRIVWVSAPAGSGKTMLLASYLAQKKLSGIWYRLESGDGDVSTFFHYLSLAVQHANRRRKFTLPLYDDSAGVEPLRFAEHYFARLADGLRPQQVVCLDDYHEVDEHSLFNSLIVALAQALPPGQCLLVGSRREPPAEFSRLLLNQELAVVREEALRFSLDETSALVSDKGEGSERRVGQIQAISEGWAAGVVLLARQDVLGEGMPPQASGPLFDYFAHELFNRFDAATQTLLLNTCYLADVSPADAVALSGVEQAAPILRRLVAGNLFTHSIAGTHYRYHNLFRLFLQNEARRRFSDEQLARLRRDSAMLLEQAGRLEEAVAIYCDESLWSDAVRAIAGAAPTLYGEGRSLTLAAIIDRLPANVIQDEPWLLHWRGVVNLGRNAKAALADLAAAFDRFVTQGDCDAACWSWVAAVQYQAYNWQAGDELIDWLERRWRQLGIEVDALGSFELRFRVTALMALGLYETLHRNEEKAQWLARFEQMIEACSEPALREEVMIAALFIYFITGETDKIRRLMELSRPEAVSYERTPLLYLILLITYPIAYLSMGDIAAASRRIAEAEQVIEDYGVVALKEVLLKAKVLIAVVSQDHEVARDCLAQMKLLGQGNDFARLSYVDNAAHYYRESGKYDLARRYTEEGVGIAASMNYAGHGVFLKADLLESLAAAGEEQQYLDRYPGIFAEAERSGYHTKRVQLRIVEGERLLKHGDRDGWFRQMEEAMRIAARHSVQIYCGWSRGQFSRLMLFALQHGVCADYAKLYIESHRELLDPQDAYELQWSWPVRIHTLGRFEIEFSSVGRVGGERVEGKSLALLKLLVTHGRTARELILEALYPGQHESKALNAYYVCLHRLRKALGGEQAIVVADQALELNPRWCWVDADAFETFNRAALADKAVRRPAVLALYHGEYLPAEDGDGVIVRREALRGAYVRLVLDEAHALSATDGNAAIDLCLQALAVEPTAEAIYQQLIRLYVDSNRHDLAAAAFEQCRRMLASQLDIEPATYTRQLAGV